MTAPRPTSPALPHLRTVHRRGVLRAFQLVAPLALASCAGAEAPGGGAESTVATAPSDGARASDGGGSVVGASDGGGPTALDAAHQRARALSLEEAAGQLVWVGAMPGHHAADEPWAGLAGGWFLLGRWNSPQEIADFSEAHRGLGAVPALLAADQEGGKVRVLRGSAAQEVPAAASLGEEGPEAVHAGYTGIGEDLARHGIDVALSPVADVVDPALGTANAPVGQLERGFGTDPALVSACVSAAVEGLDAHGVAATLKHFPGLGGVTSNTDHAAEGITDEQLTADHPTLESFRAGIAAGAQLVMLSSAIYPQLDPENPAMFSATVVEGLLRGAMAFDGPVITDDIGAAVAVTDVPVADRITRLLEAGGDAVLTADPALTGELIEAAVGWAQSDPAREERLRESAARMLRLKETLGHAFG